VKKGSDAVLKFLQDLAKGQSEIHLIKVMMLGDKCAGKSSLADSLVNGRPTTRAKNDRTVGIEVRKWRVGEKSKIVANIYDLGGHHVYRATHGYFMSDGALFLIIVRSDVTMDEACETILVWMESVQQESPGAIIGIVWTHVDETQFGRFSSSPDLLQADTGNSSAKAEESRIVFQRNVLARVKIGIDKQVGAIDEAMRHLEDMLLKESVDESEWLELKNSRDKTLESLNRSTLDWKEVSIEDEYEKTVECVRPELVPFYHENCKDGDVMEDVDDDDGGHGEDDQDDSANESDSGGDKSLVLSSSLSVPKSESGEPGVGGVETVEETALNPVPYAC